MDNTHEIAQRIAPDPADQHSGGATEYIDADLNEPEVVVQAAAKPLDFTPAGRAVVHGGAVPYVLRTPEQIVSYFDGLELVEPGVVMVTRWRPEPGATETDAELPAVRGVARQR